MASHQPKKYLRIGVFRGQKSVEERVVKKHQTISFGKTVDNTFTVASTSMPDTADVFVYDSAKGTYTLNVPIGTKGRLVLKDGKSITLDKITSVTKSDDALKVFNGNVSVLLPETARGKVTFGKITILFQFVSAKEDAGALLYAGKQKLDFRITDVISLGFLIPLILSAFLHIGFLAYVLIQDWPRDDETIVIPTWFKAAEVQSQIDLEEEEPEKPQEEPIEDPFAEPSQATEIAPEPDSGSDASKSDLMEQITDAHREQGAMITAQILGVEGDAGDYFGNMLGSSAAIADMSDVSASDIGMGGSGGLLNSLTATNGGAGDGLMNINSDSAGSGPRVVTTDDKKKAERAKVTFKMSDSSDFTASAPAGSKQAIEAIFKKKAGDIKSCYQRVMNAQGKVTGKFVVVITVGKDGVVMKVDKNTDQIGGEMFSCVRQRIMNWKFGKLEKPITFKKTWVFN